MYGADWLYVTICFSVGLVSTAAAAGFAGKPTWPCVTSFSCTGVLSMYFRKLAHAGSAAWVVQEKPSPPPSRVCGSPAPPATVGKGNQPSSEVRLLFVLRADMTPGSQSPCSSIAALPFATMPAELPAPCWAGVLREAVWNGLVFMKEVRSVPAFVKHGWFMSIELMACWRVAVEHSLMAKYSHQNASGH